MKNRDKTSFIARLGYWSLLGVSKVLGLLPFRILYDVLARVIYWMFYRVLRYRVKVTRSNLANSFPEKSENELRTIEKNYYRHLAEVVVDTLDMAGMSAETLRRRFVIDNYEEFKRTVGDNDWVAALSHYGSWEYFSAFALDNPGWHNLGVYHPLHSRAVDMFYLYIRRRFGLEPTPKSILLRHIIALRHSNERMIVGLISDQTPPFFEINHWFSFLNQPTPFFWGMEKISIRFGMPVYFMHVEKTGKAHYRAWFEMIYDGKEKVEEFEITQRYATLLEAMIRERPELWMWSHRRWKHTPDNLAEKLCRVRQS